MSPDEWKKVDKALKVVDLSSVTLKCDGYRVVLVLRQTDRFHNAIYFYIDGFFRAKWGIEDCEERRRFFCPGQVFVHPASLRKHLRKLGKRQARAINIDPDQKLTTYRGYWTSFKRLKAHLIKHNEIITLEET